MVNRSPFRAKAAPGELVPGHQPSQIRPLTPEGEKKGPGGRPPTVYRAELALAVCEAVAEGKTLEKACAEPGMPKRDTFRRWVLNNKELREAWMAAREMKAHSLFDEALDMARTLRDTGALHQSAKVRAYDVAMNQLRWSASKLNPQEYGDQSGKTIVVPVQINTSLEIGAGSQSSADPGVYKISAVHVEEQEEQDG